MVILTALVLAACGGQSSTAGPEPEGPTVTVATPTAPASPSPPAPAPTPSATPTRREKPDPRWQFYTSDHAWHTSPWFAGQHRVMIGYGCNTAPWYAHDPRCPGQEGFHHGIDVAMACGTPLFSAVDGVVVDPASSGAPGSAYGIHPFRIRTGDHDVLIGHTIHVFVQPGQHVRPGQRIALAGDSGAPDGCHLHFEVRRAAGGLSSAVDPAPLLQLR